MMGTGPQQLNPGLKEPIKQAEEAEDVNYIFLHEGTPEWRCCEIIPIKQNSPPLVLVKRDSILPRNRPTFKDYGVGCLVTSSAQDLG